MKLKFKYKNSLICILILLFILFNVITSNENILERQQQENQQNQEQTQQKEILVEQPTITSDTADLDQHQQQHNNNNHHKQKPSNVQSSKIKYEVMLGRKVQVEHFEESSTIVPMTLSNGTKYNCYIPKIKDLDDHNNYQWSAIPSAQTFADALSSLEKGPCILYKTVDWWSYEYCHNKMARQVHFDQATNKITTEFLIGSAPVRNNEESSEPIGNVRGFDTDFLNTYNKGSPISLPEKSPLPYYSEIYDTGAICDILNINRKAEIRYYCNNDPSKQSYIQSISEPSSCYYIFKIYTNQMCIHPLFKPKHDILTDITCVRLN